MISTIEVKGNVIIKHNVSITGNLLFKHYVSVNGNVRLASGGGGLYPHYTGEYIVTPRVYEQYLDTDSKVLDDDVTILQIPKSEVTNVFNGLTVTIG